MSCCFAVHKHEQTWRKWVGIRDEKGEWNVLEFEFQRSLRETAVLKSPATIIGEEGIGGKECQKERLREKSAGAYMFLKLKEEDDEEIVMSIIRWSEEIKKRVDLKLWDIRVTRCFEK